MVECMAFHPFLTRAEIVYQTKEAMMQTRISNSNASRKPHMNDVIDLSFFVTLCSTFRIQDLPGNVIFFSPLFFPHPDSTQINIRTYLHI